MVIAFSILIGVICGGLFFIVINRRYMIHNESIKRKLRDMYYLLVNWKKGELNDLLIKDYILEHGYKNIAIYGMRELGELLYADLTKAGVDIICVVDQDANKFYADVDREMILPKDMAFDDLDLIIVTAISYYNEIKKDLMDKTDCPVVSLDEIVRSNLRKIDGKI